MTFWSQNIQNKSAAGIKRMSAQTVIIHILKRKVRKKYILNVG